MPTDIPQWCNVDRALFEREIRPAGNPAVLKGVAQHWPLVQRRADSPAALIGYLKSCNPGTQVELLFGDSSINGRFFYSESLDGVNFQRIRGSFGSALEMLQDHAANPAPPALALQALSMAIHLPAFDPKHQLDLAPRGTPATVWIGNAATVAPHFDFNENIACVAFGRRRFVLFPPEQVENLYIGPLEFTPQGVPISLVDVYNPDPVRFPRFRLAMACAYVADLDPGDAIYIPYMWWHSVRSLAPLNVLINYWWNPALAAPVAPFHCLLHGLISIANLPDSQRNAWKSFFDHFVFQINGHPGAHIDPAKRGLLGSLSMQDRTKFTAALAQLLGQSR